MSEEIALTPWMPKSVAAAVVHVTRNISKLHRNERNKYAEYNYVSIDAFYEALGPLMADAGIFTIVDEASSTIDKGILLSCYEIYLVSENGEMHGPIRTNVAVKAAGPQAYASAKSYAEKYFLRQIFKVPTGEKVDADMHDKEILPNVEPQIKKFDNGYSHKIRDELIKGLQDCNSLADLKKWEATNNNGVKRKLSSDDANSIDDEYDRVKKLLTRTEK